MGSFMEVGRGFFVEIGVAGAIRGKFVPMFGGDDVGQAFPQEVDTRDLLPMFLVVSEPEGPNLVFHAYFLVLMAFRSANLNVVSGALACLTVSPRHSGHSGFSASFTSASNTNPQSRHLKSQIGMA